MFSCLQPAMRLCRTGLVSCLFFFLFYFCFSFDTDGFYFKLTMNAISATQIHFCLSGISPGCLTGLEPGVEGLWKRIGSHAQTWNMAVGLGGGLEATPSQGRPSETHFIDIQVSLAALVGFQTALRKMTQKLVVYASSIYCNSTRFVSFFQP